MRLKQEPADYREMATSDPTMASLPDLKKRGGITTTIIPKFPEGSIAELKARIELQVSEEEEQLNATKMLLATKTSKSKSKVCMRLVLEYETRPFPNIT